MCKHMTRCMNLQVFPGTFSRVHIDVDGLISCLQSLPLYINDNNVIISDLYYDYVAQKCTIQSIL